MILDSLTNADKYVQLHHHFARAFKFIKEQDLAQLPVGKYEIEGTELYASVSLKEGVKASEAKFEAHNRYIDIQVCPAGTETLGWKPRAECNHIKTEYNEEKDVLFFADQPDTLFQLKAGQFTIFFPEDVHAPGIGEGPIKKLVVKVKL